MKLAKNFLIILPTTVVWLLTALFLLVYAFDLFNTIPQMNIEHNLFSSGVLLLFITACLATGSLYGTGFIVDKNPQFLKPLITGSLVMCGICMMLIVIGVDFIIYFLIGLPSLGIFLGILATGAGALYAGHSEVQYRGRVYAVALFVSAIISICIISFVELLKVDFQQVDFRLPLIIIGILAILTAIIFYSISRSVSPWVNDKFPTPIKKIINRRSVKAYLVSHFFIYLMIGIAFSSLSQVGQLRYPDLIIDFLFIQGFQVDQTKLFWILVFFGDLLLVLPMGWFSDRIGRKSLVVAGVYGIVISALIAGLSNTPLMFYFSAFLLGISFSAIHPSIDSAVWCDLSPLDSVGRYNALGFISLLQGIGCGLAIGLFILPLELDTINYITYILIGFAVLGLFPLFFVSDSFEPLDIYLLLLASSGMCLFSYDFDRPDQSKITQKDLTLVAGALSAISTFFENIGEEHAVLDLVRHGRVFTVQAKAGTERKEIIATIFANKIDPELQSRLETFVARFCLSYHDEINDWIGQIRVFEPAVSIAEDVFGPLLPSKTILGSPKEP